MRENCVFRDFNGKKKLNFVQTNSLRSTRYFHGRDIICIYLDFKQNLRKKAPLAPSPLKKRANKKNLKI